MTMALKVLILPYPVIRVTRDSLLPSPLSMLPVTSSDTGHTMAEDHQLVSTAHSTTIFFLGYKVLHGDSPINFTNLMNWKKPHYRI